jgi:hypothetical protein
VAKVRSYDFHNMPTKKEELEGLLPILNIAAYVDKFHNSKKTLDQKGLRRVRVRKK